jgi:hypothetical protein
MAPKPDKAKKEAQQAKAKAKQKVTCRRSSDLLRSCAAAGAGFNAARPTVFRLCRLPRTKHLV